jgi:hypothetical protein
MKALEKPTEKDIETIKASIRKYEKLLGEQPRFFNGQADLDGLDFFDLASYFNYLVKLYNQ